MVQGQTRYVELPQHPVWPKQQRHYGFQIELPCPTGFLLGLGFLPPSFLLMPSSNNNDSDDPSTLDIVLLTLQSWSDHPPSPTTTIINNHHLTTSALAPSTYLLPSPGYYRLLPSQFPPLPSPSQPRSLKRYMQLMNCSILLRLYLGSNPVLVRMVVSNCRTQWMDFPTCWVIHQCGVGYLFDDSTLHLRSSGFLREV